MRMLAWTFPEGVYLRKRGFLAGVPFIQLTFRDQAPRGRGDGPHGLGAAVEAVNPLQRPTVTARSSQCPTVG